MRPSSLALLAGVAAAGACSPRAATVPTSSSTAAAPAAAVPARSSSPPVVNPTVPGDVPALLATSKKTRCPPHQVAPGLWVRFHCGAFDKVANTRKANPGKLRMLRRGTLHLDEPVGSAEARDGGIDEATWQKTLPASVDHRQKGTEGPVMSQDQVGCCSAFSLASTMNNAIRRQDRNDSISPMHVWSHYFVEGMAAAAAKNANRPLALLPLWPYDQVEACKISQEDDACDQYYHVQKQQPPWEPAIQAKLQAADAHGTWKITSVTCVAGPLCEPPTVVDPGILAAYLSTGVDLWAAMWIDDQAWYHPVNGSIPDYDVPAAKIADNTAEGHGISFAGYDWTAGSLRLLIHNSWGAPWGDQGYAWISEAMVRKYLQAAYKVTAENLATPPPPPGAPGALTDDDCPEDELVDSVTGRCATMCAGDHRAAAGKCPS
jgi:hypothetical protein